MANNKISLIHFFDILGCCTIRYIDPVTMERQIFLPRSVNEYNSIMSTSQYVEHVSFMWDGHVYEPLIEKCNINGNNVFYYLKIKN